VFQPQLSGLQVQKVNEGGYSLSMQMELENMPLKYRRKKLEIGEQRGDI
jgi:hypothetical protein